VVGDNARLSFARRRPNSNSCFDRLIGVQDKRNVTYQSVVIDIPQEHRAVAGRRSVEIDDERVDAVLGRTQISNVVPDNELQRRRIHVTRRTIVVCSALQTSALIG